MAEDRMSSGEARMRLSWGAGIATGMGVGVALGVALNNMGVGIAIGIALGVTFAIVFGNASGAGPGDGGSPADPNVGIEDPDAAGEIPPEGEPDERD